MAKTNFKSLQVYQLAERLADDVWTIVLKWNIFARDTVGKQLVKAADSIGANIAEGTGRGTFVDNRRFVRIARGSLNEPALAKTCIQAPGYLVRKRFRSSSR